MSAIASFYVLDRRDITRLEKAAQPQGRGGLLGRLANRRPSGNDFRTVLHERGRALPDLYEWSGYCLVFLLMYLQEDQNVSLLHSEYDEQTKSFAALDGSTFLMTPAHKAYLPQLDPATLDEDAVRRYFAEMNFEFDEAGMAARDALVVLREQLAALGAEEVLLVHVG